MQQPGEGSRDGPDSERVRGRRPADADPARAKRKARGYAKRAGNWRMMPVLSMSAILRICVCTRS